MLLFVNNRDRHLPLIRSWSKVPLKVVLTMSWVKSTTIITSCPSTPHTSTHSNNNNQPFIESCKISVIFMI